MRQFIYQVICISSVLVSAVACFLIRFHTFLYQLDVEIDSLQLFEHCVFLIIILEHFADEVLDDFYKFYSVCCKILVRISQPQLMKCLNGLNQTA